MGSFTRPNVLYAVSHDLRADFDKPNLRRLAASSSAFTFSHAFSQAPYCTPSRASFFTGRRPSVSDIHTFEQNVESALELTDGRFDELLQLNSFDQLDHGQRVVSGRHLPIRTALPRAFRDAGYSTYGAGIVLMGGNRSWVHCEQCWNDGYGEVRMWGNLNGIPNKRCDGSVVPCQGEFESSHDFLVATDVIGYLRRRVQRQQRSRRQPFFVMVGFWGGHQDYASDLGYFDEWAEPPFTADPAAIAWDLPVGTTRLTHPARWDQMQGGGRDFEYGEFRTRDVWRSWRRGYLAAESKTDAALGMVVRELDALKLTPTTVVVFHGDHGLSGGEYGVSGKGKLLDVDTRVPLLLKLAPAANAVQLEPATGSHEGDGGTGIRRLSTLVQLIDLYPTLCDLARIACPPRADWQSPDTPHQAGATSVGSTAFREAPLDGRSLLSMLTTPRASIDDDDDSRASHGHAHEASWWASRTVASSQPRCSAGFGRHEAHWACISTHIDGIEHMGTSIRSPQWRLVLWAEWDGTARTPRLRGLANHVEAGQVELFAFSGAEYNDELRGGTRAVDLGHERTNLVPPGSRLKRLPAMHAAACQDLYEQVLLYWASPPPPPVQRLPPSPPSPPASLSSPVSPPHPPSYPPKPSHPPKSECRADLANCCHSFCTLEVDDSRCGSRCRKCNWDTCAGCSFCMLPSAGEVHSSSPAPTIGSPPPLPPPVRPPVVPTVPPPTPPPRAHHAGYHPHPPPVQLPPRPSPLAPPPSVRPLQRPLPPPPSLPHPALRPLPPPGLPLVSSSTSASHSAARNVVASWWPRVPRMAAFGMAGSVGALAVVLAASAVLCRRWRGDDSRLKRRNRKGARRLEGESTRVDSGSLRNVDAALDVADRLDVSDALDEATIAIALGGGVRDGGGRAGPQTPAEEHTCEMSSLDECRGGATAAPDPSQTRLPRRFPRGGHATRLATSDEVENLD